MKKQFSLIAGALACVLTCQAAPAAAATATSVTIPAAPSLYRAAVYTLTVQEGPFRITGAAAPGPLPDPIVLQGVDAPVDPIKLVADKAGNLDRTLTLPAGTYSLTIAPTNWKDLTLTGADLALSTSLPQLTLSTKPYVTANVGVTLLPALSGYAGGAPILWIGPDGQSGTFTQGANGAFGPVTLTTANMTDGIYIYTVMAANPDSGNTALLFQPVLVDRQDGFSDVPASHWGRRWIETAYHLKIVSGRPDGSFAPDANITRAEFAKMLVGTLGRSGGTASFADIAGHWGAPYIQALGDAGIAQGELLNGKRYFYPDRTISRQEAAAMIARAFALEAGEQTPSFKDWNQVATWAQLPISAMVEQGWLGGFPDGTVAPTGLLTRAQAAKILGSTIGI